MLALMSAFSIKRTLDLIVLNVCYPAEADIRLETVELLFSVEQQLQYNGQR